MNMKEKLKSLIGLTLTSLFWSSRLPQKIKGPNTSCIRFIIHSHPRSGSTMVLTMLGSHPNVFIIGEPFGQDKRLWDFFKGKRYLREFQPIRFLKMILQNGVRDDIHALGFKLFPEQLRNPRYKKVPTYLSKSGDVKIIFLKRKNLLAQYTSFKIAQLSSSWNIKDEASRPSLKIGIDRTEFFKFLEDIDREDRETELRFSEHDVLNVFYEEILRDKQHHLTEIQTFLNLTVKPLSTPLIQKEVRPLNQVISNYNEVIAWLQDSKWSYLIDA